MANSLWDYLAQLEQKVPPQRNRIALTPLAPNQPAPFNPFVNEVGQETRPDLKTPYVQDVMQKYGGVTPTNAQTENPVTLPNERPRIVPNQPVSSLPYHTERPTLTPIEPVDELTTAENNVRNLRDFQNNPVQNNDEGILGRIGDVLRQAVVSAGQSYDKGIQSGQRPLEALAGAGGAAFSGGLAGGFRPTMDEERQRLYDISKGDQDVNRIKSDREWKLQQDLRTAQLDIAKQKPAIEQRKLGQKDEELEMRRSKQDFQRVNTEQKTVLSSIMKRGAYKEGANPEEDARLQALGIVLPDFDSRKRTVKEQAGKFYQLNPDTNTWEESQGISTDESEVPIDFIVNGKNMKLRPRDIATIEASKERQLSQQTFTADQSERTRQHQTFLQTSRQNFDREKIAMEQAQKDAQNATTQQQKIDAEKRAEESRKRIDAYQKELQKELLDYKKEQ